MTQATNVVSHKCVSQKQNFLLFCAIIGHCPSWLRQFYYSKKNWNRKPWAQPKPALAQLVQISHNFPQKTKATGFAATERNHQANFPSDKPNNGTLRKKIKNKNTYIFYINIHLYYFIIKNLKILQYFDSFHSHTLTIACS